MKVNREGQAAVLSDQEAQRLIMAFNGRHALRDRAIFVLMYFSGMRRNECRLLNIGDLLDQHGNWKPAFLLSKEITKTHRSRLIPLHQEAVKRLLDYLVTRDDWDNSAPLFTSQLRRRLALSTFSRIFEVGFRAAGIVGASTHSMRRTVATNLSDKNVPVKVISRLLGHSNLATTDRYIQVNDKQIDDAVRLLK